MRILMLAPHLPWPAQDGGRIRMHRLARGLARDHDVVVLALAAPDEPVEDAKEALAAENVELRAVTQSGQSIAREAADALVRRRSFYASRYWSSAFARELQAMLANEHFDAMQAESLHMAAYPMGANSLVPWVLDEYDIGFVVTKRLTAPKTHSGRQLGYRIYAHREHKLRRVEELQACRMADIVITTSDADAAVLAEHNDGQTAIVIPNGVDLDGPPWDVRGSAEPPSAVYVAKMDYRPNIDAVTWFAADIFPRILARVPGFGFTIVGINPPPVVRELAEIDGIRVTGLVTDPRPYLQDATVCVIPLRAGSGTRLKALESMALGRPVVSTSIGVEGLGLTPGIDCELADDAEGFAQKVVALVESVDRRTTMTRAARDVVERRFTWDASVERLEAMYADLLQKPERRLNLAND